MARKGKKSPSEDEIAVIFNKYISPQVKADNRQVKLSMYFAQPKNYVIELAKHVKNPAKSMVQHANEWFGDLVKDKVGQIVEIAREAPPPEITVAIAKAGVPRAPTFFEQVVVGLAKEEKRRATQLFEQGADFGYWGNRRIRRAEKSKASYLRGGGTEDYAMLVDAIAGRGKTPPKIGFTKARGFWYRKPDNFVSQKRLEGNLRRIKLV